MTVFTAIFIDLTSSDFGKRSVKTPFSFVASTASGFTAIVIPLHTIMTTTPTDPVLRLVDIKKSYGKFVALKGVSVEVELEAVLAAKGHPKSDAVVTIRDFQALWNNLFPAEQARIVQLLVRRVTVTTAGLEVDLRKEGAAGVIREMIAPTKVEAAE